MSKTTKIDILKCLAIEYFKANKYCDFYSCLSEIEKLSKV